MKAPAKINIFLKITGLRGNYHEICSRFIRYDALYDEISFVPGTFTDFTIEGMSAIKKEHNIIYKAYKELLAHTKSKRLGEFFYHHKVHIIKNIPMGAGLGGGSSDAATFLLMANKAVDLQLEPQDLAKIGAKVGADVPFFIYGYKAANVSGIGEKIEEFMDDIPPLELKLLPLHCDTAQVYQHYRKNYLKFDPKLASKMAQMSSCQIFENFTPLIANDLYQSAINLCPSLAKYKQNWYLSGSGSTLFRSENENSGNK
ncbi:4-(cytidine 5'-diphospho)-2-C-methyl-D-erythritol kinase [Nitratiruptor tergarcus]|uniref:4-diphosphocytidyl-2-C-methyl-D-erythritol kinase n=1 Tax=Nitratiruptor tergarcus DSM 16512 TaxID=1069081 RepID=A0A1W1WPP8_9BACT|nr:4-(cytidine 5'-diphospho)-2-C-methyl-D-erythritol kinase [Nitratiruptor tergarcus]SMC08281.1 4-diphosphocytidyl-2-C-methyl-D-erythritol kinase [Nitratiruptor tergarcus DSM 16512]